jgi:hypothetical protein
LTTKGVLALRDVIQIDLAYSHSSSIKWELDPSHLVLERWEWARSIRITSLSTNTPLVVKVKIWHFGRFGLGLGLRALNRLNFWISDMTTKGVLVLRDVIRIDLAYSHSSSIKWELDPSHLVLEL